MSIQKDNDEFPRIPCEMFKKCACELPLWYTFYHYYNSASFSTPEAWHLCISCHAFWRYG